MRRLFLFMALPLAEIAMFVIIGGEIGLLATLAVIFLTGVAGVMLLKAEVRRGAIMMQQGGRGMSLQEGKPIAGVFRAFAAVLLILPGFITDFVGLLLLLPPVQMLLTAAVMKRITIVGAGLGGAAPSRNPFGQEDVIDGEWVEVPPQANHKAPPSRWVESSFDEDREKH